MNACIVEGYDHAVSTLATILGTVVVSVNYRLAPKYRFPAGLDDCEIATRYFMNHASKWNVDTKRIALSCTLPSHLL